jgi:uncharacterized membrane protein
MFVDPNDRNAQAGQNIPMNVKTPTPPVSAAHAPGKSSAPGLDQISQNIETILAFYSNDEQKISASQRVLEAISGFVGRPLYLGAIVLLAALWIFANVMAHHLGFAELDPAPFFWLQGLVSLGALLTTTVLLIKQNRLAKLEERRAHLELQVNLLTEQKTTKLINLMEELRRDLPMVRDRDDPEAAALQQPTDAVQVLAELDERREAVSR